MNGMGISKVRGIEKDCSFGLDWLMVNDIKEKPTGMNELKKGHFLFLEVHLDLIETESI